MGAIRRNGLDAEKVADLLAILAEVDNEPGSDGDLSRRAYRRERVGAEIE